MDWDKQIPASWSRVALRNCLELMSHRSQDLRQVRKRSEKVMIAAVIPVTEAMTVSMTAVVTAVVTDEVAVRTAVKGVVKVADRVAVGATVIL